MERHPTKKQTTTKSSNNKTKQTKTKTGKKTVENFMEMRLKKLIVSPLPKHTQEHPLKNKRKNPKTTPQKDGNKPKRK